MKKVKSRLRSKQMQKCRTQSLVALMKATFSEVVLIPMASKSCLNVVVMLLLFKALMTSSREGPGAGYDKTHSM